MRKQTTKIICAIIACAMMLTTMAFAVSADDVLLIAPAPAKNSCGNAATWAIEDGTLTISGTGTMDSYELGKAPWSGEAYTAVVVEDGIASIGNFAFANSAITSVTIPASVLEVGQGAFYGCAELTAIELPADIYEIHNLTFAGCVKLASVTIPSKVVRIGNMAFEGCSALTSITLPEGLTTIGTKAFNKCATLTAVTIPGGVEDIPYAAFANCPALANVTIAATTKTFDEYAFDNSKAVAITAPTGTFAEAYAKANNITFNANGNVSEDDEDYGWVNPFTDLSANAWYYDSVKFVNIKGIMLGTSDNTFDPTATLTRAMFVTLLYRIEGSPEIDASAPKFNDVPAGKWYTAPVVWAAENGIVNGRDDVTFDPNGVITNQEMAAVIYRYAASKGVDTTVSGVPNYSDKRLMAEWALDPITWCAKVGVMNGNRDGTFTPKDAALRYDAADVFAKYVTKIAANY